MKLNRRDFLATLGAAGAAATTLSCSGPGGQQPIALQLYTIRDASRIDFTEALRTAREMGFRQFEFAGYGDMSADELNALLEGLGARPCGTHEGFERLVEDTQAVIEYCRAIGSPYIVVPSMPSEYRGGSRARIEEFARQLDEIGTKVREAGMQLCYHNHSFEFETVSDGDETVWDVLFGTADPDLVKAEVDVAWVANAGLDPVEFMGRWGDRVRLLHMKDLDEENQLAPVGTGVLDMPAVIAKGREIGVDWYIIELDRPREGKDILSEVQIAYTNLSQLMEA